MSTAFARYWQAVTHRSYAHEQGGEHYERLEFLGDAVLQLAISELLVEAFPDDPPGSLTNRRKQLVGNAALAEISREIGLPGLARLGLGEQRAQRTEREKFQADILEAVIGALYAEEGWEVVRAVVRHRWTPRLRRSRANEANPKVALQERVQQRHGVAPTYRTLSESGPPHDRVFAVSVEVHGTELGRAIGSSKKLAQRAAAEAALRGLGSRRTVEP